MMFTVDEAEALSMGLRMAAAWADPKLWAAAQGRPRKLESRLHEDLEAGDAGALRDDRARLPRPGGPAGPAG